MGGVGTTSPRPQGGTTSTHPQGGVGDNLELFGFLALCLLLQPF
jgi:hypothetical protein